MMKININLKPKHVPDHQLLHEPDETNELPADKAKIYRSCIGILLYIASDFVECQYAIRGLAQTMSRPTVQAFICLGHLCLYLLGCVDHCTVMKCTDHQGLLHYTPNEYTMEVYADSMPVWQPAVLKLTHSENYCTLFCRGRDLRWCFSVL